MTEKSTRRSGEHPSDEELYERIMARPEVQAQLEELLARRRRGEKSKTPDITTEEELVEFLREHG